MKDTIYAVLVKYYGRMYGENFCDRIAEYIATEAEAGRMKTRGDVMAYIWICTSGGGVAEASSADIQKALPDVFSDTMDRTY